MVTDADPTQLNLDVYATKTGVWNPESGDLVVPDDWEFLPAGDAFVTRHVKAGGVYWVAWRPRGRNREHRRKLGLFAPSATIDAARAEAEDTSARRAIQREASNLRRDRVEADYRSEFAAAVLHWLDFAPNHADVAAEIAASAAEQAAAVGSGRVGRTKTLPLDQRAALAARAFIRHRYTDYEHHLLSSDTLDAEFGLDYAEVKSAAHRAVDAFLASHRQR